MTLFDAAKIPFSRKERFVTLSVMDGALMLRSVRGGDLRPALGRLARVGFCDAAGQAVAVTLELAPDCLIARSALGEVRFVVGAGERLHVAGQGMDLTLRLEGSRYDYAYRTAKGQACLVAAYENIRLAPRCTRGTVEVSGDWRRDRADNVVARFSGAAGFEGVVDLFAVTPPSDTPADFNTARAEAAADFAAFHARFAPPRAGGAEAHRLAAYLLWANTVPAGGHLSRPAVYMSKNHMINVWSWDNVFSALGLAGADGALAYDQFAVIYDQQDASGALPDFVNDREASFAFTKPPVHGWGLSLIAAMRPDWLTDARRLALAKALAAQVGWWLRETRAGPGDLPAYPHGNDSGWDNASFFDRGGPVASPDLPTFLILCCDCLAALRPEQESQWQAQARALLALLMDRLATDDGFGTRLIHAPDTLHQGDSLIGFMPLLLGDRLPRPLAQALIARLRARFLTPWGVATEAPDSAFYEPDGYWRGPIWAPTTALIWDGLRRQGEAALARDLAERFCTLCETSGMAENYDALTGAALRDPAFAWSSAMYLLFSDWLGRPAPPATLQDGTIL